MILREQLKQYMSVVQLLKKDDTKHATPPPDYHHEANHFEDKLVQVMLHFFFTILTIRHLNLIEEVHILVRDWI